MRVEVNIRRANGQDSPAVMDLTSTIWGGEDYIPYVWNDWLQDPLGALLVAEQDGKVLGLAKLTVLSPRDWWMEGLRVHPEYEGHGIAAQLHDFQLAYWLEHGAGSTIRLTTHNQRFAVHHLCERSGFTRVAEISSFSAPAEAQGEANWQALAVEDTPRALQAFERSPVQAFNAGMVNWFWRWAPPSVEQIEAAAQRGGLFAIEDDFLLVLPEPEENYLGLQSIACALDDLPQRLAGLRRMAAAMGCERAGWSIALGTPLVERLEGAGFIRSWNDSLYLYARPHPSLPES